MAHEQAEASSLSDIAQVPEDVVPAQLAWSNMLFREAPREFCLQPVVPDRPLVVKPAYPVTIPEEESGLFFVPVPVFIKVVLKSGKEEQVMGTVPSQVLSDTWFGTPVQGDLCYSVPMLARLQLEGLESHSHHIVFPVEIQNQSEEKLVVEKICLRTAYATLYCGSDRLWGSTVKINHEGGFKGTSIRYSKEMPGFEPDLNEVSKPLKKEERRLYGLTFNSAFHDDIVITK